MEITSRENPKIKHILKLSSSSRLRREEGLFVSEGLRLCRDAAIRGVTLEEVYYTPEFSKAHADDLAVILDASRSSFSVSSDVMKKISDTVNPQGVLAICKRPEWDVEKAHPGFYVALDGVSDPSNLGAISRSAEAFGAAGLILASGCCDPYSPKSLRAGMGALLRLPIYTFTNFSDGLQLFKASGYKIFASVVTPDAIPVNSVEKPANSVLVIGNEANGISDATARCSDCLVTIPMSGRAESLNAAAAAAVLIWEFSK